MVNLSEVNYRMEEEGIDYCFRSYSHWDEIKDEKFHRLRNAYLDAAEALERYVKDKSNEEE